MITWFTNDTWVISDVPVDLPFLNEHGNIQEFRFLMDMITHFPGEVFGRLTTIERAYPADRPKGSYWRCMCECGNESVVLATNLYGGVTKSCGCLRRDSATQRERKRHQPYRGVLRYYKRNAKIRGISWELEEPEFAYLIQQDCYYCGNGPTQRKIGFDSFNGIDRINNESSYRFETCVPCCATCNWAKNRLDQKEFYDWIGRVADHLARKEVMQNV